MISIHLKSNILDYNGLNSLHFLQFFLQNFPQLPTTILTANSKSEPNHFYIKCEFKPTPSPISSRVQIPALFTVVIYTPRLPTILPLLHSPQPL